MQIHRRQRSEKERIKLLESIDPEELRANYNFDRFAARAVRLVRDIPTSIITLISEERQHNIGRCGTDASGVERQYSFCNTAVTQHRILIVEDAREHPEFRDNPQVKGPPNIRFYAGIPLLYQNSLPVGTLCVYDSEPRQLDPKERALLMEVVWEVEDQIARAIDREWNQRRTALLRRDRQRLGMGLLKEILDVIELQQRSGKEGELEAIKHLTQQAIYVFSSRGNLHLGDQRLRLEEIIEALIEEIESSTDDRSLTLHNPIPERTTVIGHQRLLTRGLGDLIAAQNNRRPAGDDLIIELIDDDDYISIRIETRPAVPGTFDEMQAFESGETIGLETTSGLESSVFSEENTRLFRARNIISAHGGTVTYDEMSGRRSTLVIRLPRIVVAKKEPENA